MENWLRVFVSAQKSKVSERLLAARLIIASSPRMASSLLIWALLNAAVPVLLIVAAGELVGTIHGAFGRDLSAVARHRLTLWLWLTGAACAISLVLSPIFDGLRSASRVVLTFALQRRLMEAVSAPVGIGHLEASESLNELARAQGSLTSYFPADAPAALAAVVSNRLGGIFACVALAAVDWRLGTGFFLLWISVRQPLQRILFDYVAAFGGEAGAMQRAEYLLRTLSGGEAAKEIRVFGLSRWLLGQYREHWFSGMKPSWKTLSRYRRTLSLLALGIGGAYALGGWLLASGAQSGRLTLAELAFSLPLLVLTSNVGTTTMDDVQLEWMVSALPNLNSLESRLQGERSILSGTVAVDQAPLRTIEFVSVSFAYEKSSEMVFEGLDLTLRAGESTAIVGPNGVGKTTLVKMLCRLYDPTGGEILVDGVSIKLLDPVQWQQNCAAVFQDFSHYPLTLAENIALGYIGQSDYLSGVISAASRAGLGDLAANLPNSWDTGLSTQFPGGIDLSVGQWQRVALARALFAVDHGARLLILDEPTASLDVRGEAEFYDHFLTLTAGVTTVLISHRFSSVRQAQSIYVLDSGRVVEHGTHHELMQQNGTYARLFKLQSSRFDPVSPRYDDQNAWRSDRRTMP